MTVMELSAVKTKWVGSEKKCLAGDFVSGLQFVAWDRSISVDWIGLDFSRPLEWNGELAFRVGNKVTLTSLVESVGCGSRRRDWRRSTYSALLSDRERFRGKLLRNHSYSTADERKINSIITCVKLTLGIWEYFELSQVLFSET